MGKSLGWWVSMQVLVTSIWDPVQPLDVALVMVFCQGSLMPLHCLKGSGGGEGLVCGEAQAQTGGPCLGPWLSGCGGQ
jgi:hypothetical protein